MLPYHVNVEVVCSEKIVWCDHRKVCCRMVAISLGIVCLIGRRKARGSNAIVVIAIGLSVHCEMLVSMRY
jgi:hypothetical protein